MRSGSVWRRVFGVVLRYTAVYCLFGVLGVFYLLYTCLAPFMRDAADP